ncbi:hypothetical protein KAFR_0A07180 [Kazachstania africana CBS 2517]|uniref:Glycine cleavage system P protein n=1 Tax=Kazachstania africana (strain ATCC 22294 / BCRC 22015 / CBS 2517 / CECT 1963 / NBRC 1671 / NRRL Y-8276) TaxID=1071382 RepID=H2AP52_KAZAF|nr:hypothetical protein KAFR_0A07180 [Kazachstania africana CBS 2517]CCF56152.1 hypothetical protein KAFR_0A07180 [Kazachstania africana CBS 2517]
MPVSNRVYWASLGKAIDSIPWCLYRKSPIGTNNNIIRFSSTNISSQKFGELYENQKSDLDRPLDTFLRRHIGPSKWDIKVMLKTLGYDDLETFIESLVPRNVLERKPLHLRAPAKGYTEQEMLKHLQSIADKNNYKARNFIGKGYYGTFLPPVIQRNLLENPGWYTSYTPYQAEISQGRLESLLNFQTVVSELTGLPIANSSLLDEGTAAAEAMLLSFNASRKKKLNYVIDSNLHLQTKSVLYTKAQPLAINIIEVDASNEESILSALDDTGTFGSMIQYPGTDGSILPINTLSKVSEKLHSKNLLLSVASDLMALTLLKPPSAFGADIVFGSSQRFGVPMGFGGPHAAFFAVVDKLNRKIPGRIVGVSKDRLGNVAYRLALQTREQHIKRDKATSNICTAQALSANIASNYCIYHGPQGLKGISQRIYGFTSILAKSIITGKCKHTLLNKNWFDTLTVKLSSDTNSRKFLDEALTKYSINLFAVNENIVSLSLDETVTKSDVISLLKLFLDEESVPDFNVLPEFPSEIRRNDAYLNQSVFNKYHSETAMLRYLHYLQNRDLSLANSMIPLGSCTMKLNSVVEMLPITWPQFANIHPFQPVNQVSGYIELTKSLSLDLAEITGLDAVSLQPNSGAQGEYTGLRVIRSYLNEKGEGARNVCLIPISAHGTNPASAAMCGMKIVPIKCLQNGMLDIEDLKVQAEKYKDKLAAFMITYPSTYGLYEPVIKDAIDIVHSKGGLVYLDGANMNAQLGLTSPGYLGADVCHLNLHKTFAIPHGGGGPGVGAICVRGELVKYLPSNIVTNRTVSRASQVTSVSSAEFGNALVLPISYSFIKMLGSEGLPFTSVIAMLNANYLRKKLEPHYKILFLESNSDIGGCAHEFIIDLRGYKSYDLEATDIAKRLQDYGFHSPTLAFPVPGTLMVEPTESENLQELDRFIDSMISIKQEIDAYIGGVSVGNVLKQAPHSLEDLICSEDWETRGYSRESAAYPLPFLKKNKFWPAVARIDDVYGDMNLMCTCPAVEDFEEHTE